MRRAGFTIVELLIAIIVIGILTVIAVAAYTDSQKRGRDAQTITAAQSYSKAILAYAADNGGEYPPYTGSSCLGIYDWPDNRCSSGSSLANSNAMMTRLAPYLGGTTPQPTTSALINNTRGIFFSYSSTDGYYIYFTLENTTTTCTRISGTRMVSANAVGGKVCRAYFPEHP